MVVGKTDADQALIVAYGVDVPKMAAFMSTPEFAERTRPLLNGRTIYALSEMEPPA